MAESEQPSPAVLDATVLSNFALTDNLDLLGQIPVRFVTVEAVEQELRQGVTEGYQFLQRAVGVFETVSIKDQLEYDPGNLDRGEKYVIQAALERAGTIVTDDRMARELANNLLLPVTGSVGLMIRLVREEELTEQEANEIHARWVNEGKFRSHVESITEALDLMAKRDEIARRAAHQKQDQPEVSAEKREQIMSQISDQFDIPDDEDDDGCQ